MEETKKNSVIEDIYYSFLKEKNNLKHLMDKNKEEISELELFLKSYHDTDMDMKFFSPRDLSGIDKAKKEDVTTRLSILVNENDNYFQQIKSLDMKIKELNDLLLDSSHSFDSIGIMDIQEKERQRIARELHDTTVQNLTHLVHMLELSSLYIDKDADRAKLELQSCNQHLKKCIDEIRSIIFNLRPMSFDDLGFSKCIEDYMQNVIHENPSIFFDYQADDFLVDLPEQKQLILFRMIQEAIQNAIKHSNTDKILLYMKHMDNERYKIGIQDFGDGFKNGNIDDNHFGISIMKERAKVINATLEISSELNVGTTVEIIFDVL